MTSFDSQLSSKAPEDRRSPRKTSNIQHPKSRESPKSEIGSGAKSGRRLFSGAFADARDHLLIALRTSVVLSALFLVVYGGTNWLAAHRLHVGTLYFPWEHFIPFVPIMIIPYMSIDLFFVAAPFLCRDKMELNLLTRRIIAAILISGACFLLFPLRFAFARAEVGGWLGAIFKSFRSLDQPYNLVPSLHITLLMILAQLYLRRTRGVLNQALKLWFMLIAVSTLLTYQHHLLDVLGGFVLGILCLYLLPEVKARWPVLKNGRIGTYYLIGSAATAALAWLLWPWGSVLLWPALSLATISFAYFGVGPGIFQKWNGKLPLSTRLILGPCLFGQWLSLRWYQRRCAPWDEVAPGVLIGRKLNDEEASEAVSQGITAVLDLTGEFSEAEPFLRVEYLNIPILDLTAPRQEQLEQMAAFIEDQVTRGKVYVHCKIGYSRSAAAIGAYLLVTTHAENVREVMAKLRRARPSIIVRSEVIEALKRFEHLHEEQCFVTRPVSALTSFL